MVGGGYSIRRHQLPKHTGLPQIYNSRLRREHSAHILVFVHDDVWIDDPDWMDKLRVALGVFDVAGVAGNTRITPGQPAWIFIKEADDTFVMDEKFISGGITHGSPPHGQYSPYGVTPARCELLDGVFLAIHADRVRRSNAYFDERFSFDFYDMDFCRRATQVGLRIGTWPIALTHQSVGEFGNPRWRTAMKTYFDKWGD